MSLKSMQNNTNYVAPHVDDLLIGVAKDYMVSLHLNNRDTEDNHGSCVCGKKPEIWLGRFDDNEIKIFAFFHEIGHIVVSRMQGQVEIDSSLSKVSWEGAAWEIGRVQAAKYGYRWGYHHKCSVWARQQLGTYIRDEYTRELFV